MADDPIIHGLPDLIGQNPTQPDLTGQAFKDAVAAQTQKVMQTFREKLPSNYKSEVTGPWYTLQFQALAEEIATVQVTAQQTFMDFDFDYTRAEFLWQMIGQLVFPESINKGTIPEIDGDITYRDFLKAMVVLLLQGATKATAQAGAQLLTTADVTVIEKVAHAHDTGTAWGFDDQHTFEVNVEKDGGTDWPDEDPFVLQENVRLVLKALKPAKAIYEYRHLFRDAFEEMFTDEMSWVLGDYHYDDLRGYCLGARAISGTAGETHTDRTLFSDPTRDFTSISAEAVLEIPSGSNQGLFEVTDILTFPVGDDTTARAYTTSPTGLAGFVTISGDVLTDSLQNWGLAVEGELLTMTTGANAGTYRLKELLGPGGGPIWLGAPGPATKVRIAPTTLRLRKRMPVVATGQSYEVTVDRLGKRDAKTVVSEDAAAQFYK